ncbi:MAG: hypothetical protein ACI97A_000487 [Planctomycetota bacterium]|jgi:hypothetical protein
MGQDSNLNWLWPACLLTGINAVVLIVLVFSISDDGSENSAIDGVGHSDALLALTKAVDRLAENGGQEEPYGGAPRRAADSSAMSNRQQVDLNESLKELAEAVAELSRASSKSVNSDRQVVASPPFADAAVAQKNLAAIAALDKELFRRKHHMWTRDKLLSEYGNPTEMSIGQTGGLYVFYIEESTGAKFQFGLHDGLVIYTHVSKR